MGKYTPPSLFETLYKMLLDSPGELFKYSLSYIIPLIPYVIILFTAIKRKTILWKATYPALIGVVITYIYVIVGANESLSQTYNASQRNLIAGFAPFVAFFYSLFVFFIVWAISAIILHFYFRKRKNSKKS